MHNIGSATRSRCARRSLKVALVADHLALWGGGRDFLRLCAGGLWQKQRSLFVTFSLLVSDETPMNTLRRHLGPWKRAAGMLLRLERPNLIKWPRMRPEYVIDAVSSFGGDLHATCYRDRKHSYATLIKVLYREGYDVVLPFLFSPGHFPLPWVGYIPDIQHKHHPEFFSLQECARRDLQFTTLLRKAKAILVNSRDAKRDIEQFYPGYDCAIFNLPFAPILNPDWLESSPGNDVARYNLPKRYFLVSNQFWAHKSHRTAFEALSKLDHDNADVCIVCTGNTADPRCPEYFPGLKRRVVDLGLQDRVLAFGHIPKHEQIQIMRGSVAVIQPTLFEGGPGGGAAYDAVCTATPLILSDIPVNREVEAEDGSLQFFRAGCVDDLADKMRFALARRPDPPSNEELRRRSDQRAERLGSRLLDAIEFVSKPSTS
jgi:glycosyltransferase involved in cell wall biosynthesis